MRGVPKLWRRKGRDTYYIRFYDPKARRTRTVDTRCRIGQESEANRILAEFIDAWNAPDRQPVESATVGSVLDEYYHRHASGLKTAKRTQQFMAAIKSCLGEETAISRAPILCKGYADKRGISSGTARRELAVLQAAINYCHTEGLLDRPVRIPKPPGSEPRFRYLTTSEIRRLLAVCSSEHMRLYIEIALNTGARRQAIQELRWEQVDFTSRVIRFNWQGREESKKLRATVPINSHLLDILKQAKEEAHTQWVLEYDGRPAGDIKRAWMRTRDKAGLKGVQSRDLRRTAGVTLAQAGVDMRDIAQILGHTDIKTTYKHYAPYSPNHARKAVEKLARKRK